MDISKLAIAVLFMSQVNCYILTSEKPRTIYVLGGKSNGYNQTCVREIIRQQKLDEHRRKVNLALLNSHL